MKNAFIGPSYQLVSKPASVQRTIGMYPVPIEPGNERTKWVFKDFPGLVEVFPFQAPVSTETVLFLFHMTDTAGSEGIAEFASINSPFDQTGANWDASFGNGFLRTSSPKFGAASLATESSETWTRDLVQADPVPDNFSTVGINTLQIDAWVMQDSDGNPSQSVYISVGVNSYPFETSFTISVDSEGIISFGFESADEESYAEGSTFIEFDEWVHLRLLCVGNSIRMYRNGIQDPTVITTTSLTPIQAAGPINLARLTFSQAGTYLDDARASIGGSADIANFTPPAAPWPNP